MIDRPLVNTAPLRLYRHFDNGELVGFVEGPPTSVESLQRPRLSEPVNFLNRKVETCLYRHFDAEGHLLYVGISLSHLQRLGQHRSNAHWFDRIERVEIERFPSRKEAKAAEDKAIFEENPECNIAGVLRC